MVLRTNVSVNQLSIYGAAADMCDELACRISGCSEGTGKLVAQNNAETMVMPTEFSRTNNTPRTNEIVQGNLLHDYERTFENLPDHLWLITLCSDAGVAKTVAKRQHFTTLDDAELDKLGGSRREYTITSRQQHFTQSERMILGNTKIGSA